MDADGGMTGAKRPRGRIADLSLDAWERLAARDARIARLASDLTMLEVEIARVREEQQALMRHRDDLLASTSWRITGPLRWVITRLRRSG